MRGDGVPGGAFQTGYVVVPTGNVIFANADTGTPDGSLAAPYPNLGPSKPTASTATRTASSTTSAFQPPRPATALGPVVLIAQGSARPFVLAAPAGI